MGEAFDGFFAISERAFGAYMDGLDGADMRRLLPSLFAALDGARVADVSDSTGFGIWRGDGNAPHPTWREALLDIANDRPTNRTHGWRARLEVFQSARSAFDVCLNRLHALVEACPEARHVVHSDLLHFNVLVDADRITAVFDWGSSLYGDFVFDVAWFTFWQPWYPAWSGIDFAAEAERHYAAIGLDVPGFRDRLRCCELYIGLDGMAYQAFVGRLRTWSRPRGARSRSRAAEALPSWSMRALELVGFDGPASLQLGERPVAEPGAGEVRVAFKATALNHLDVFITRGLPKRPLPAILGSDGAGTIDAVGEGVRDLAVGDEVVLYPIVSCGQCPACQAGQDVHCPKMAILGEHTDGTFQESLVVPASICHPRPSHLAGKRPRRCRWRG